MTVFGSNSRTKKRRLCQKPGCWIFCGLLLFLFIAIAHVVTLVDSFTEEALILKDLYHEIESAVVEETPSFTLETLDEKKDTDKKQTSSKEQNDRNRSESLGVETLKQKDSDVNNSNSNKKVSSHSAISGVGTAGEQGSEVEKTSATKPDSYREEHNVFRKLEERVSSVIDECRSMKEKSTQDVKKLKKDFDTGVPPLPEHGLHDAIKGWFENNANNNNNNKRDYPVCQLPPSSSCNVTSYSVIIMSHTVTDQERLRKMILGMQNLAGLPNTSEIILVWNGEKEALTTSSDNLVKKLLMWENDSSHPVRIFYALENSLENNLLNRYHPSVQPSEEAVLYFDDDGPFLNEDAIDAGFKLWQLNSDTQIGSMPRNIRFTSERMKSLQLDATALAVELFKENAMQVYKNPYGMDENIKYPKFTPICSNATGDSVEYNFFVFPPFQAHMALPSGTFLHKNFLCFIWHPIFEKLRQYILDHPTHPDDMLVSTIVSHLSGRIIRTFPRRIKKKKTRALRKISERIAPHYNKGAKTDSSPNIAIVGGERIHDISRKLLWQHPDWAKMREEAINSIFNYFGSITPGSVGWCVGSPYQQKGGVRDKISFMCDPEFPSMDMIPWMNEDNTMHNCGKV